MEKNTKLICVENVKNGRVFYNLIAEITLEDKTIVTTQLDLSFYSQKLMYKLFKGLPHENK